MSILGDLYSSPQLMYYVNGQFVPAYDISVELTAYDVADTAHATTFFDGLSDYLGGTSLTRLTQILQPCPIKVLVGDRSTSSSFATLTNGFVDELEAVLDQDTMHIKSRGILSLLIDQKITTKALQSTDAGAAIRDLISRYGLNPIVSNAGVTVGKILRGDFVSTSRNLRVFDFIQTLANGLGWDIRISGASVVVGPPGTSSSPRLEKTWGSPTGGTKLKITHAGLHSHNIKVKVISYIPKSKAKVASSQLQGPLAASLGLPAPSTTARRTRGPAPSGGGAQRGSTATGRSFSNTEVYVFHVPGIDANKCDALARKIADDIARHEFVAELTFAPSASEIATMANAGMEFQVNLTGISDPAMNGLYTPRRATWNWSVADGLEVSLLMVNHPLPENSEGVL